MKKEATLFRPGFRGTQAPLSWSLASLRARLLGTNIVGHHFGAKNSMFLNAANKLMSKCLRSAKAATCCKLVR